MGRPAKGTVVVVPLADGTDQYRVRFRAAGERHDRYLHERRDCPCGCGGGWSERTANVELANTIARVQAGVWTAPPPRQAPERPAAVPTFHEYSSRWLHARVDGVLGDKPISPATYEDYLWRLGRHLLPYFGTWRMDELTARPAWRSRST